MTTLNGLPISWESFIHGICSRRRLARFSRLWEDCTQEEAILVAREEKLGDEENQALAAQARKGKRKKEDHSKSKLFEKYFLKNIYWSRANLQVLNIENKDLHPQNQVNTIHKPTTQVPNSNS
jgi:hypothetical protein